MERPMSNYRCLKQVRSSHGRISFCLKNEAPARFFSAIKITKSFFIAINPFDSKYGKKNEQLSVKTVKKTNKEKFL